MRFLRSFAVIALASLSAGPVVAAEESARLSNREAIKLSRQIVELMEATSAVVPELARAGAPMVENVRQSYQLLQVGSTRGHAGVFYKLLSNARIFVQVSDAVPKPAAFADEVREQLGKLRAHIDRADAHFRATLDYREEQVRGADRDNLQRYAEENRLLGPAAESERRVVFLGDSITDGWKLNQFFPGKPYINRGIGGQITGQMLGRMQADVVALQPAAMVVLGGTNDLARGVPLATIRYNLTMIADLAVADGIKPVFASILPVSDYHKDKNPNYERTPFRPPSQIGELNRWLERMCQARGLIYLDYYSGLVDSDGQLQASFADDGLHPNSEGYKVMAPRAQAAIDRALRGRASKPKKKRFGIF